MKFCIETLGCKVNQYETQAVVGILLGRGHEEVQAGDGCDVCIINTCAVTGESARKSRRAVRRMRKKEPEAYIAVCGCLAQTESDAVLELGADIVGGSGEEFADKLEEAVRERSRGIKVSDMVSRRAFEKLYPAMTGERTRALLKVQDGCDNFCAYCIIPYARGRVRSLAVEDAVEYTRRFICEGYREIVITGIEIASYGKDLQRGEKLIDLLTAVGAAAGGVRIRLGSLDPRSLTVEFCEAVRKIGNICPHFHLSVQSGCDETLRRMNRRYTTAEVTEAIQRLRVLFPDCGITADLITGFPGESAEEFEKTLLFINESGFSDMHIFPYSPRPGTAAAGFSNQVDVHTRRKRAAIASKTAQLARDRFVQAQIGKIVSVLFERERNGLWLGYSENYIEIAVAETTIRNCVRNVQITHYIDGLVWGKFTDCQI